MSKFRHNTRKMTSTQDQLKQIIPLYSDLADLLLEFLEPCLDYSVSTCTHKNAFCHCGNIYLTQIWFDLLDIPHSEKFLLEKFCPFCGTANPHKSKIRVTRFRYLVRAKKYLGCPRCLKQSESYDHKFCSSCQHKLTMQEGGRWRMKKKRVFFC